MLVFTTALVAGFLLLMWSADRLTDDALHLGQHLRLSKLVIGIVVLGFGTSAPELLVSSISAWQGNPGLAIGNALGSNTTNILLILGATLCISPLYIDKGIMRKDFTLLLAATALFLVLILDHQLSFVDGMLLIIALMFTLYWLAQFAQNSPMQEESAQPVADSSLATILISLTVSLVILLLSSELVVWSAISIADHTGVNDLIIGLTIVALGTSLPELATCIASVIKKHGELALGNIIGSNIFNTLGVVGVASLIAAYSIPEQVYMRDFPIMVGATAVLFLLGWVFLSAKKIPRSFGILFVCAYSMYIFFIYQQTV